MKHPCYQCPDRHVGCHGKCEKYLSLTKVRTKDDEIDAYMRESTAKLKKFAPYKSAEKSRRRYW